MKRLRIIYLIIIFFVIAIGLLARLKQNWFPDSVNEYLGDALYAVMMYYLYSFLLLKTPAVYRVGCALATCYCVEFLQLCQAPALVYARATLPGRLILGQKFLWSDILAYTVGVGLAFCVNIIYPLNRDFKEKA